MGNMSYCRFNNTANALGDCLDAIENNELDDMAGFEYEGIENIINCCEAILEYRERLEELYDENRKAKQNR